MPPTPLYDHRRARREQTARHEQRERRGEREVVVGWIGEHEIEAHSFTRESPQRTAHIAAHDAREIVELERAQVAAQRGETRVAALDEHRVFSPPGKRFDAERAGSRVQVEHTYTVEIGEPREQRLAHAIRRRPNSRRRSDEAPTTQTTSSDAHLHSNTRVVGAFPSCPPRTHCYDPPPSPARGDTGERRHGIGPRGPREAQAARTHRPDTR